MKINEPFGPWKQGNGSSTIRRDSGSLSFYIFLNNNLVNYSTSVGDSCVMKQPGPSLAEAVTYVDNYIANYFEVEKTAEEKLAEALAEIAELKAKLAELEVPKPKFKVGQRVTQPHWTAKDVITIRGIIKDDEGFRYKAKGWEDWINYPEHILVSAD